MLETLIISAVSALIPAATDGLRGLFTKLTGGAGAQPANAQEYIQMQQADVARLQALATLDQSGSTSQWVADVRALQRPAVTLLVLAAWVASWWTPMPEQFQLTVASLAQSVVFYLFGDRTYMYLKKAVK